MYYQSKVMQEIYTYKLLKSRIPADQMTISTVTKDQERHAQLSKIHK